MGRAVEGPVVIADREVPPAEVLDDLRARGPISAAIADLHEDVSLDRDALRVERYRLKADALAAAAALVVADPKAGPVGEMRVRVGRRTVVVSDVHVDETGALVCTVDHPDIPEDANPFRFVNPPVQVPDGTVTVIDPVTGQDVEVSGFKEDPVEAFRQMVRDVVATVVK